MVREYGLEGRIDIITERAVVIIGGGLMKLVDCARGPR